MTDVLLVLLLILYRSCRKTISIMQFFSNIYTKIINFFALFNKGLSISLTLISLSVSYPVTTNAGLFSFIVGATGDQVSAKTVDEQSASNSQNMVVLHAAINSDPNSNGSQNDSPLVSGNTLVAEIGPAGTVSDIDQETTNTQISLYVVRKGDILSKIADMYDVTVNTIIWANDLGRNPVLQEGQKLVILPISGVKYTVKKGDTLRNIANKYKTDLNEVLQFNDLTLTSMLIPGDVVIIPDAEPVLVKEPIFSSSKNIAINPTLHGTGGPYYPGYYIRPVDGGYKSQGLHGYNAVDLAVPLDTPIHAAAEGIVIASVMGGWHGGYGNYVIVSHPNGTQTLYAHTLKNFVSVGDHVDQGQMIAKSGSTGNSTGPHVHFEIRGARNPF